MTQNSNPLMQYFRQPAIYLTLPSKGEYWANGSLDMSQTNELPIYPMTAIDEITYRTPDALFNGQAVVSVVQSCVPGIKDAWKCPSSDLNAILTAIRIASYGHDLELSTTCPKCSNEDTYTLDLRNVLEQMTMPDFSKSIKHGDLEISFCPLTYQQQNETNQLQFENQRLLQMIPESDLPDEEKIQRLNEVLVKITELTIEAIKYSISSIRTPTAIVTETKFIEEFLKNCDRNLFTQIKEHVISLRESSELKPLQIQCQNCEHEYQQPLTLDMTSFFAHAS